MPAAEIVEEAAAVAEGAAGTGSEPVDSTLTPGEPAPVGEGLPPAAEPVGGVPVRVHQMVVDPPEVDPLATVFAIPLPGSAVQVYPARRYRRRRQLFIAAAAVVAVLVGGVFAGVWWWAAPTATQAAPTIAAAPTPHVVVSLPGFATTPTWTGPDTGVSDVVVSADGKLIGSVTEQAVTVSDDHGRHVQRVQLPGAHLVAGTIGTRPALIVYAGATAHVFTSAETAPVVVAIPDGAGLLARGAGVLVLTGDNRATVGLLTLQGVTPYVSPRAGTVPAGVAGSSIQWVSAHGLLFTATAAGTAPAPTQLAAPAPGAVVRSVLTAGTHLVTNWALSDGTTVLAVHDTTTGALTGKGAAGPSPASLVSDPGGTVAMSGTDRVNLTRGTVTTPAGGFTATTALGGGVFYGGTATATAVQDSAGRTRIVPTPTATPVQFTGSGDLVTVLNGRVAVFAKTPPKHR